MSSNKPNTTGVKPMPPWGEGPKPPVKVTEEIKLRYLYELRKSGLMSLSAELVGVSDQAILSARKKDPEFEEAVQQAKCRHTDEVLIKAAIERAVNGVQKPIMGGKFKDEIVAYERIYSDSLLSQLLKARSAEFREPGKESGAYDTSNGGVLIIPAAPATIDDWQEQFGAMAKGTTGRPGGSQ